MFENEATVSLLFVAITSSVVARVVERRVNSVNEFTVVQRAEGPTDLKKCGPRTLK